MKIAFCKKSNGLRTTWPIFTKMSWIDPHVGYVGRPIHFL